MMDALRPFLSRILAAFIAALCTWLTSRYKIEIEGDLQKALADALSAFVLTSSYAVSHRLLDKFFNPADTASSHLAVVGKEEVAAIKTVERTAELPVQPSPTPSPTPAAPGALTNPVAWKDGHEEGLL
jgi:hypothetical protein